MEHWEIARKINSAIKSGKPVVALETAVISTGLPYPENLKVAKEGEKVIKEQGAVPATIGIIEGKIKIGLSEEEIEQFARAKGIVKTNLSNLACVIASGGRAATTVSATMSIAASAGIKVLSTGGIGGVHPEGFHYLDISPDLTALTRYSMIVVCSGVKSLLNIAATREALETLGIPVLGYKTNFLPGFYVRQTECRVDLKVKSPAEVARVYKIHGQLGNTGSLLVTQPVPPGSAIKSEIVNNLLDKGLREAKKKHITGRALTPFVLDYVNQHSQGKALKANMSLLINNARLAAQIAAAVSDM